AVAGADGRHLPPGIRAAVDWPVAGDLADIESARPARDRHADRQCRGRQGAAARDPQERRRAHRRYPALYRRTDENAVGERPAERRGRTIYSRRSAAAAGAPVEFAGLTDG